jgi:hypothetical protein
MIIRVIKHIGNMCIVEGNKFGDGVIAKGLHLMIRSFAKGVHLATYKHQQEAFN